MIFNLLLILAPTDGPHAVYLLSDYAPRGYKSVFHGMCLRDIFHSKQHGGNIDEGTSLISLPGMHLVPTPSPRGSH